jgi:hypothetical protein
MTALPSLFQDVFTSAVRGVRDGLSPRLLLFSLGLWVGAILLWTILLLLAGTHVQAFAGFVTAWALLGFFVLFPTWLPAAAQAKLTGVPLATGAQALLGPVFTTVTWIVLVVLIVAAVYLTVRIAVEVWLMPLIRQIVEKHYPPFPPHPPYSIFSPIGNLLRTGTLAVVIGLPCLLIPVANAVLLFVLFGYLNVRTLVNESLDGIATREEQRLVVRSARLRMICLGSLLALVSLIPFVGLMAPAWMGAGTCHLCLRTLIRLRNDRSDTSNIVA